MDLPFSQSSRGRSTMAMMVWCLLLSRSIQFSRVAKATHARDFRVDLHILCCDSLQLGMIQTLGFQTRNYCTLQWANQGFQSELSYFFHQTLLTYSVTPRKCLKIYGNELYFFQDLFEFRARVPPLALQPSTLH